MPTFGSRTRTNSGNGGTCLLALPRPASDRPLMRPAQGARGLNSGAPAPALPLAVRGCGTRSRLRCPYATAYNRPHAQSVAPDPTGPRRAGGHRQPTRNQPCGRGGGPPNPPLPVAPPFPPKGGGKSRCVGARGGNARLGGKGGTPLYPPLQSRAPTNTMRQGALPPYPRHLCCRPPSGRVDRATHARHSPANAGGPLLFFSFPPSSQPPQHPNSMLMWREAPVNA